MKSNINTNKKPASNILVVSENQELSLFLKNEIDKVKIYQEVNVDFCYTSFNDNPQQMIEMGAKKINVKDERVVEEILKKYDLVFSLHCKQIFPKSLVNGVCCINFHPGINPYNRGWYPQVFSIINGLPVGATIHLMDSEVDHGEIIAQRMVDVKVSDTSLEVYRKTIESEKDLIRENITNIINGTFNAAKPNQEGNYNGIQDFKDLCKLDLRSLGTLGEHLNLLRATTHGDFKNAYFVDEFGKRYYVRISIEESY